VSKEREFQKRLEEIFHSEALEHRQAILTGLLEIEKGAGTEREVQLVETIFREAHSLKGAARAVKMTRIEALCQSLESIFSILKKGQGRLLPEMYDTLFKTIDRIEQLEKGTGGDGLDPDFPQQLAAMREALAGSGSPAAELPVSPPMHRQEETQRECAEPDDVAETIRVSSRRMGSLYLKTEELLTVREAAKKRAESLLDLAAAQQAWKSRAGGARQHARNILRLKSSFGASMGPDFAASCAAAADFIEADCAREADVASAISILSRAAAEDATRVSELVDTLLKEMRSVLMLPFSSLLELFPRMVRDLAQDEGRQVAWSVTGDEIEVDRRVLEGIKDALIHLVRNCVSHGIETPSVRKERGKEAQGRVSLKVSVLGSDKVELTLSDDGAGIDIEAVKSAAVKRGYLGQEEASRLDGPTALSLIFLSEVSTSPLVTDLSGRGLGLAIAREKVEALGGSVTVTSRPSLGTEFRLTLPLTLSTFRGVIVRAGGQRFVIPTVNVEKAMKVDRKAIVLVENRECIALDGGTLSLVSLSGALGMGDDAGGVPGSFPAVILHASGIRGAFRVEEIQGEQEVLVKSLGRQLAHVRNISGATVLDGGGVLPILNPAELLASASRAGVSGAAAPAPKPRKSMILLAEDSSTSRVLLQSILLSAGYEVKTAVDGAEAFATLHTGAFDLLVSDVDMPRMSGFELTKRIRADSKLADLPVVLVTSLDSREDREEGVDAGANAYIVKSSFDQGNLLETIGRLL
jgi:two-component system, chemotaxis family, sensor kinase CheA